MIRLSKQLLLLENIKELEHAGLNKQRWQQLITEYGSESDISWDFDRAFYDEKANKLTLIAHNQAQPENEEFVLTITLQGSGKNSKVTHSLITTPST